MVFYLVLVLFFVGFSLVWYGPLFAFGSFGRGLQRGEDKDLFCRDDPTDADLQTPNEEESDADDVLLLKNMNSAVKYQEDYLDDDSIEGDNTVEY